MTGRRRARGAGFSLVELMIAVAITGILAAVAIPSYRAYIARSHRSTAQIALSEAAQYMERYYTAHGSYASAALQSSTVPKGASGTAVRYNLTFSVTPGATAFTVQAEPANAQSGDACGTLSLTHTGVQGAAATGCW